MHTRPRKQSKHRRILISAVTVIIFAILAVLLLLRHHSYSTSQAVTNVPAVTNTQTPELLAKLTMPVIQGDNLTKLFKKHHLPLADLRSILKNDQAQHYLTRIKPGEILHYQKTNNNHLLTLIYPINAIKKLVLSKQNEAYKASFETLPLTEKLVYKNGTVTHSLGAAAHQAGLSTQQLIQLKSIFAGSINLEKHARRGDHFSLLSQEYYLKQKKYRNGDIVAANYTHHGKEYQAIRYTYPKNHTGYYTKTGHGVEPLFLSAPLHYRRISSFFTYHRLDPYLHVMRPHLGVDYAAPRGTPVRALGDGKVVFCGRDNGYGNAIIIRFNRKYKALYGHLQRFASHLKTNQFVHKGQIIGYVGSTGWSTGPHLHFSMYVYGVSKDPLQLKFPGGKSIPKSYLKPYRAYANKILAQLSLYEGPEFAENK